MTQTTFFFLLANVAIGIGIIIETLSTLLNQGKPTKNLAIVIISGLIFIWLFVCAGVLYFWTLSPLQKSVPIVFIFYMIASFFYAGNSLQDELPNSLDDLVFKKSYLHFCLSFGLVFVLWTLVLLLYETPLANAIHQLLT